MSAAGGVPEAQQKGAGERDGLAGRVEDGDLIGAVVAEEGVVGDVEEDEDAGGDDAQEAQHDDWPAAGPVGPLGQQPSDEEAADDLANAAHYPVQTWSSPYTQYIRAEVK